MQMAGHTPGWELLESIEYLSYSITLLVTEGTSLLLIASAMLQFGI